MKKHFLLLALAAVCSLSVWGQYTSEWDGWAWRENLPSANVASNKNDIVVTSTFSPVEEWMWSQSGHAFDLQGQSDGHIDITTIETANWEFSNVMIETWYRSDATKNTVYIQFYTSSSIDETKKNGTPILLNADGQNYLGNWGQVPAGSRSARIYRTATSVGPFVYGIHITTQKQVSVFHTVHFVAGAGQGEMEDISVGDGRTISLPAPQGLHYAGHTCTGWSDGSTTYTIGQAYTVTGEVTFTAQWEEGYFAEWGYLGNGIAGTDNFLTKTAFPSKTASVVGEITLTSTAETDGWYKDLSTDVNTASSLNYLAVHNNTLTVTGSLSQNKVLTEVIIAWTDFTGGGGLQISFYSATNMQVGETKTIPVTSRSGLQVRTTFPAPDDAVSFVLKKTTGGDEWNTAVSYIKVSAKDGAAPTETYTVSFNTHGGSSVADISETSPGTGITLPAAPTKTNYIFDGWYTAEIGGTLAGAIGATYYPAENCTLHAHWAQYAKSVNFVKSAEWGGYNWNTRFNGVQDSLDLYHYTMSPLGDTQWDNQGEGSDDAGLKSEDGDRDFSFWVKSNSNVTITLGTWQGAAGGNGTAELQANGVKIADLAAKTANGPYTTDGDTKFTIKIVNPYWSLIQKINIEALAYTLTLKAGEGATGDDVVEKLKENATYTLNKPEGFSKDGYHFKEWSDGTATYAAGATFTMPAKNVTLTAQWEEDSEVEYTVEYANGGGTWTGAAAPTEDDHKAGETFKLPASTVVTRDGYQFAGWNDGANTFDAEATYTMPAKAVTLTATWNQLYAVTYNAGDVTYLGTLPTQEPQIASASFKVAAGIKCQGYAFKGWKAGTTTYQPNDDFTMPASAVEFVAQWEEKIVSPVTNFTATGIHKDVTLTWQFPATSKRIPVDLSSTTKREGQGGNFTVLSKESNLATISYNATGDWAYIYVHVPLGQTLTNFETITLDYKGNGSSAAVCYPYGGLEVYKWYNTECNFGNTDWQTMSSTPTTALHFGGTYTHTIDAIGFAISGGNAPAGVVSFRNVILTLSEGEWIEGMKLLRKAGSAPTCPTDAEAEVLVSEGLVAGYQDIVPVTVDEVTYHYALYNYDADGNYSVVASASYTFEPQNFYTVTYEAGGATGDVPVDEEQYIKGTTVILKEQGNLVKGDDVFMGWSDGAKTYKAGAPFTMPNKNVTFTAVWDANGAIKVPEEYARLNVDNLSRTNSPHDPTNIDGGLCVNLGEQDTGNGFYGEWDVYLMPGIYKVSFRMGTDGYAFIPGMYLVDKATDQQIKTEHPGLQNSGNSQPYFANFDYTWDLTGLDESKVYIVRVVNEYPTDGSRLKVHYIDFIPTITIDQSKEDNLIFDGKANVTLIRPLVGGTTNSICLPFALNRDQINTAFGTDAEVWALTNSTLSDNNMTLDIEFDKVDEMAAGVPYLIQPGTGYDANVNPVFNEIEMSTTLAPVVHDNLDFIGTVQKSFVSVGYKDHLFVGSGNMVYYPSGSGDLNGMRAYFHIKYRSEADVPAGVSARMILGKTTPTELRTLKVNDSVRKVMKEGRIYIIRNGVVNDMFGNTVK